MVQSIQDDSHVLGDEPESFDSIEDLVSAPRDDDGIERGRLLLWSVHGRAVGD